MWPNSHGRVPDVRADAADLADRRAVWGRDSETDPDDTPRYARVVGFRRIPPPAPLPAGNAPTLAPGARIIVVPGPSGARRTA